MTTLPATPHAEQAENGVGPSIDDTASSAQGDGDGDVVRAAAATTRPFQDIWQAAIGDAPDELAKDSTTVSTPPDVSGLAANYASQVGVLTDEWAKLFALVPKDHKRRTDALQGALKLKAAAKTTASESEAVVKLLQAAPPDPDATSGSDAPVEEESIIAISTDGAKEASQLVKCQNALKDIVLGLMDLSVPVDEKLQGPDKTDADASVALDRLDKACGLVRQLEDIFTVAKVDPSESAEPKASNDMNLPPELMEMLTKKLNEEKQTPTTKSTELNTRNSDQKQIWDSGKGRGSRVIGEELWEVLCWRKAILRFVLVKDMCDKHKDGIKEPTDQQLELVDTAIQNFHSMCRAKGPIHSDLDDPSTWKLHSDGPLTDETERLFHHGVYSSTHLRALKHKAELCYWRWKVFNQRAPVDAELAAIVNRQFTHIVKHIMPGAGWIAEIEYDRVREIEKTSLDNTTAFSIDLDKISEPKGKPEKKKKQNKKKK